MSRGGNTQEEEEVKAAHKTTLSIYLSTHLTSPPELQNSLPSLCNTSPNNSIFFLLRHGLG